MYRFILTVFSLILSTQSTLSYEVIENYYFAITGDPQPYRILHSDDSYDPNANNSVTTWEPFAKSGYENLREYNPQFLMINGDMTEYGWGVQRDSVQKLLKDNSDIKTYYGLGNHDILNNVDDCHDNISDGFSDWFSSDACTFHTSNMLRNDILNTFPKHNPNGYYNHSAYGSDDRGWSASNAYAFDWGKKLRFIQLNLHPAYEVHLGSSGGAFNVAWNSAVPFLEQELNQARKDNRHVIIGWHESDDAFDLVKDPSKWNDNEKNVQKILKDNNDIIVLLTSAHRHAFKHYPNYGGTGIDMYLSGALFNSESLLIEQYYFKDIVFLPHKCGDEYITRLQIYSIENNGDQTYRGIVYKSKQELLNCD